MTDVAYIGEHLTPGAIGRFLIFLSFLSGFAGLYFYLQVAKKRAGSGFQRKMARIAYLVQTFSIVGICLALFYIIVNHYFEYAYVYKHSSSFMPAKYIISSFWAGQEGSFLLWAFFIGTFGIGAMYTSRKLEAPAMMVIIFAQMFLMSMVLGYRFAGLSLGSDPFQLLRLVPENMGNDFFRNPSYLSLITDGNGLNPLLENPWMVIHPPLLFMGYATAIFPFAFAFASLIQNDKRYWLKPTLPWISLTIGLLGIGLIMGGAWAYQSLTFGGFWAWDPVENASLVPWLVLVAALHYMLLAYKRDKFYLGTYILSFLGFVMVLYASYLTRSGVLGETSVHAFGDDGRSFQLILFTVVFTIVPAWMLFSKRKNIAVNDLPAFFTRDFMMLYGAIVLILSAFQVISTTSVPVVNKIFGTGFAPPSDVVGFYNTWQTPFAILVAVLLGVGQYVVYGQNDIKLFLRRISVPFILALVLAVAGFIMDKNMMVIHGVFLFSIIFTILTSFAYLIRFAGGKTNIGAALTHVGFGIFLLGVLIAFSNTITLSRVGKSGTTGSGDNIMLYKGEPKQMGDYLVCFSDSKEERDEVFYQIDFLKQGTDQELEVLYSVYPSIKYNSRMGNVYNPDTRNMLLGDIFMFITFANDKSKRLPDGYVYAGSAEFELGDSLMIGNSLVVFDSLYLASVNKDVTEVAITAVIKAADSTGLWKNYPMTYSIKDSYAESGIVELKNQGVKLQFEKVSDKPETIHMGVFEKQAEFIALKIMFFPWIWVLWLGTIIMFTGVTVSVWRRAVKAKQAAE